MPGFGWGPFGRRPFSTIVDLPLPAVSAAASIAAGVIYTVEIYPATGSPIYAATEQYTTLPTDSLPNQPFDGTVEKALRYKRSIIDGTRIGGMASGYSRIELNNPSGEYDGYAQLMDGARVVVRIGRQGASFDGFPALYDGSVDGDADIDEDIFGLDLFDDNGRLEIPALPSVYGGTGGIDGDANVKGKRKQIILGTGANATLHLIDAVNLVFQGHDGAMGGWAHIYDRGVEIFANSTPDYANYAALIAATITPGRWASCNALGVVRCGAKPDGTLTGTAAGGAVSNGLVAGSPTVGTALTDTASLVHYLITISGANIVVDFASVIAFKAAQPAPIEFVIRPDDNFTLRDVVDKLTFGVFGWAGFRRDRTFDMGLVALPTGSPLATYTEMDFFTNRQVALPSAMSPPPWRIRAAFDRNWTQQPDLDATVDASTQTLRKDQYSIATSTDTSLSNAIRAAHRQAQDPAVWESYFANSSDAVAFCNAVLTFMGGAARGLYETVVPADAYALNISNPIHLTDDRYGLVAGKALALMSIDDDTSEEEAILQGLG